MTCKLALAVESSCDETSLAVFLLPQDIPNNFLEKINSYQVLGAIVSSQIKIHQEYGGVIPEIGARSHASQIHYLWNLVWLQSVQKAKDLGLENLDISNFEYFLVTTNPGLASALRVGLEFAKSLKFFLELEGASVNIISVNHLRGHVASCFYGLDVKTSLLSSSDHKVIIDHQLPRNLAVSPLDMGTTIEPFLYTFNTLDADIFPHLHLLVSGGNTQLLVLKSWDDYEIIGQTLDDAVGESLDKIGRMVGLPYPAGISVSKIAGLVAQNPLNLSIGMKNTELNFSYSGMKTAVRYLVQSKPELLKFEENLAKKDIDFLISQANLEGEEVKDGQAFRIATAVPITPMTTPTTLSSPVDRGTSSVGSNVVVLGPKLEFIQQLCISAQYVAISQISQKVSLAINLYNPKSLGISGGVSANLLLRQELKNIAKKHQIANLFIPQLGLTGDNAVMIGIAGLMSV